MLKLTQVNRPFICAVITDANVDACIRTMKLAEFDGADAFELDLHVLQPYPPSKQDVKDIVGCTSKPTFTVNRRVGGRPQSEDERVKMQLDAFDAGTVGFDTELDTFDPCTQWDAAKTKHQMEHLQGISLDPDVMPLEVSYDPEAERKQMRLIDDLHARGGEVMLSTHILVRMKPEGALRVGRLMEKRGADLAKIVGRTRDMGDLLDVLACNLALKKELKIPFNMMSHGQPSALGRVLYPMFGSSWVYCQQTFVPGGFHYQPLVKTMRYILQHVDFHIEVSYKR
ncbi:MAG: type I 3-dehydroquinate dehydratase [Candidatus Bathyarchaeia archaeon]